MRDFLPTMSGNAWHKTRAYSAAVVTTGGKQVWLAGHTGTSTADGASLAGNFDEQVRQTFRNIEATLVRAGGSLRDLVSMTVFTLDVRNGDRFVQLRGEILKENFPASALVTVAGFARPEIMIEIMPVAVIDDSRQGQ